MAVLSRRSPLEILPFFEKERTIQQVDWILAFLSDAIKYKLEIQSGWQTLDLKTGVTQFADEQTALGLLTANKIMQKSALGFTSLSTALIQN